ncbi:hypothetical protein Hanom_Chr05g00399041 [Helianthus anomalus]
MRLTFKKPQSAASLLEYMERSLSACRESVNCVHLNPVSLKNVLEVGPISPNRSTGNSIVMKWFLNTNSFFSLH